LEENGHCLDSPGGFRADIQALLNQMVYQTTIPMVCEKMVRLDEEKEVITQTFYLRRVIKLQEVDKGNYLNQKESLDDEVEMNSVFNANIREGDKKVSAMTGDLGIKEERVAKSGDSKAIDRSNRPFKYMSNSDFLSLNGKDAVASIVNKCEATTSCSSPTRDQEAKVISPEKLMVSNCKKSFAKNVGIDQSVLEGLPPQGKVQKEVDRNGSMKEEMIPSSRSRASLPINFPRLPPGLKVDPDLERRRLEELFVIEKRRLEDCEESLSKKGKTIE
jgi:hypothetical protein